MPRTEAEGFKIEPKITVMSRLEDEVALSRRKQLQNLLSHIPSPG
jgi:hypothetical protein